nr:putative reverse transcriptase domain-containing protein [Tanacetum cinerariifolium]
MERKGRGSPSTTMLKLCRALILAFPDGTKNFMAYNASHNRFGTIMMQNEKAIAYDSRQLKFHEKNYTKHDLELGDIVFTLKNTTYALSRNKRAKPLRVRALVMTINSNLPPKIHKAQVESLKKENVKDKNLHGMDKEFENRLDGTLYIRRRSSHHHLCQQVLDVSKDEGLLPESIWSTGTTRNTPLEMGKYSHGFYYKTTKDNKQSRHDLEQLNRVHSTFHVSKFKKCMAEEPLAIPLDEVQVDNKLNFIEEPVEDMDRKVKLLKQSHISIVKVRWNSKRGLEFTWEREDQMQKKYPHLFTNSAPAAEVAS